VVVADLRPPVTIMNRLDRSSILLALGAASGLVVAAGGLLASGRGTAPALAPDTVARVNGVPIRADDYRRALDAVAADRREAPDAELRRHVLDRLIDEELLVQRGLELGLPRVDARVRRDLAAAVVDAATAAAAPDQPTAAELARFYDANRSVFGRGDRLHVRQVFVAGGAPDADVRAAGAAARLRAGEDVATVRAALGDVEPIPLPDGPLPTAKLADYLGPTPLRAVLDLSPGEVSDPVRSTGGLHVLVLVAREPASVPPLAEIEDEVRTEWRRNDGERALRAQLDALRARATLEVTAAP
jgi:parvulin-like peptidyl-prolyl isomerase